jgi:hypothetical protein
MNGVSDSLLDYLYLPNKFHRMPLDSITAYCLWFFYAFFYCDVNSAASPEIFKFIACMLSEIVCSKCPLRPLMYYNRRENSKYNVSKYEVKKT